MATLGSFLFSFFSTSRHRHRHQRLATTALGHQRRQRQGQCRRASGWTAQQERVAEGATRAVGARRGSRQHCWRRVDNMMRASDEQRTAGGCNDDGGGNVVAWTADGGQCNKTSRIRRTMQQHQTETADDGTGAGGDKDGTILSNYYYYLIPSSAACLRRDQITSRHLFYGRIFVRIENRLVITRKAKSRKREHPAVDESDGLLFW